LCESHIYPVASPVKAHASRVVGQFEKISGFGGVTTTARLPLLKRPLPILPTKPKPKVYPPKAMTIALAFFSQNGIVMAADSLYSSTIREYGPKIFPHDLGCCETLFTGTTLDRGVMRSAVDTFTTAISGQRAQLDALEPVPRLDAIQGIIRETNLMLSQALAASQSPALQDTQLLIGIMARQGRQSAWRLLRTGNAAVEEISRYECVGAGRDLAHYLCDMLYPDACHSIALLRILGLYTINEAKKIVEGCGGDTYVLTLCKSKRKPERKVTGYWDGDKIADPVVRALRLALLISRDDSLTDEEFEERLGGFANGLRFLRSESLRKEWPKEVKDWLDAHDHRLW